jgi:plasmid stabilization system protein ParE
LGQSKGRTPTPVQIVTILPSAREDLANGAEFYESQGEGLGHHFLETLFADIDNLKDYAGIHPIVFGYHRLLSSRFPYAIYYSTDADAAIVKAVLDCRRDPAWISHRLE